MTTAAESCPPSSPPPIYKIKLLCDATWTCWMSSELPLQITSYRNHLTPPLPLSLSLCNKPFIKPQVFSVAAHYSHLLTSLNHPVFWFLCCFVLSDQGVTNLQPSLACGPSVIFLWPVRHLKKKKLVSARHIIELIYRPIHFPITYNNTILRLCFANEG